MAEIRPIKNFFGGDQRKYKDYKNRVTRLVEELSSKYREHWIPSLHQPLVEELVRSELEIEDCDRIIHDPNPGEDGKAGLQTYNIREKERRNRDKLYDQLHVSLRSMVRERGRDDGSMGDVDEWFEDCFGAD